MDASSRDSYIGVQVCIKHQSAFPPPHTHTPHTPPTPHPHPHPHSTLTHTPRHPDTPTTATYTHTTLDRPAASWCMHACQGPTDWVLPPGDGAHPAHPWCQPPLRPPPHTPTPTHTLPTIHQHIQCTSPWKKRPPRRVCRAAWRGDVREKSAHIKPKSRIHGDAVQQPVELVHPQLRRAGGWMHPSGPCMRG